jgi:hypothetical protein
MICLKLFHPVLCGSICERPGGGESQDFSWLLRILTGWGDQWWTKFFLFFSIYRPSYLIEADVRPKKYWLVCVGLFANHLINSNYLFLDDG